MAKELSDDTERVKRRTSHAVISEDQLAEQQRIREEELAQYAQQQAIEHRRRLFADGFDDEAFPPVPRWARQPVANEDDSTWSQFS